MSEKAISLIYFADIRMPTEKAHGLQIAHMCEAFALANCEVTLVVPQRNSTAKLRNQDPWEYYGVQPVFNIHKLWTISIGRFLPRPIRRLGFILQTLVFYLSVFAWLIGKPSDVILYSRDIYLQWFLGWMFASRFRVYEAHKLNHTRFGLWVQAQVVRSSTLVVASTRYFAAELETQGHRSVLVEHNGIRTERFADMPSREEARAKLNIPAGSFVAGYVGQLETLGMDKGLGTLIEAYGQYYRERPNWSGELLIVGGPESKIVTLRQLWEREGLPGDRLHVAGQVVAPDVPKYLAACDVCTMPHPWTEFFAYYTSPIKLFEYMAAGRAILATDMPVFHEILRDGENALFVPPSDPAAMCDALVRLAEDPALRDRLARNNQEAALRFTWDARAGRIISAIRKAASESIEP